MRRSQGECGHWEGPVGRADGEQRAGAVAREATEFEGDSFDASDAASDRFDGSIGYASTVPDDAQRVPADQGAPEASQRWGQEVSLRSSASSAA